MGIEAIAAASGAQLAGGLIQGKAAKDSAKIQAASADRATQLQQLMFDQQRQDAAPWRAAGEDALSQLRALLAPGGGLAQDFNAGSDPGYQFGLNEGLKALERTLPRAYGFDSGATLKALTRYGNDYATTKYNEAFNRDLAGKAQKYNFLAGLSGIGQTANSQVASGGMNFANNAGQNIMSGGAARAAGLVGQSNALSGALSNLGNMGMQYAMFNRAFPQGSGVAINPMPSAPNYFGGS